MKIVIIGGGWVGSHLAFKLKNVYDVTIFEKNLDLFKETSYNNQNRLHLGFHYAKNNKTRQMCKNTFDRFMGDYSFLTKKVPNNYYCVPNNKSIIDFDTYKIIFNVVDENIDEVKLTDVEGCINTSERYIDFHEAYEFFNNELKSLMVRKKVDLHELDKLSKEYDLVIDCSNNQIIGIEEECFFELTLSLIYEKINETNFDAITMVDGPLFSIYPYKNNDYTLTDVEHTPLKKFKIIDELLTFKNSLTDDFFNEKINLMENKVLKYYPSFLNDFKIKDKILSIKSKFESITDNRYPIIKENGNIISCFTGKIQGIYIIEDYILNKINDENTSW
jgi:hypothetical protein